MIRKAIIVVLTLGAVGTIFFGVSSYWRTWERRVGNYPYEGLKEDLEALPESDRHKAGSCTVCKYDLTGNVSGFCPACLDGAWDHEDVWLDSLREAWAITVGVDNGTIRCSYDDWCGPPFPPWKRLEWVGGGFKFKHLIVQYDVSGNATRRNPIVGRWHMWLETPFWAPSILFAAYPMFAFIRGPLRRWRRHRKGLCLRCGYNLTGLPESRCPECGTEFER